MKSARSKIFAAFQCHLGLEVFTVATHAGDRSELVAASESHGRGLVLQVTGYSRAMVAVPVTDIVNVQIEMIAPKKRRQIEGFARAEDISGGSLALALCDDPVGLSDLSWKGIINCRATASDALGWQAKPLPFKNQTDQ